MSKVSDFTDAIKKILAIIKRKDDDFFDRLTNRYTIGFIMVTMTLLGLKNYVGDPIDCFTPGEFDKNKNWIKYTDNYCWIENTYHIPIQADLPGPNHGTKTLAYYQWVPFILLFMIFVFYVPSAFWGFAMSSSGYDVQAIVKVMSEADSHNPEKRDKTTEYIAAQLNRHVNFHRSNRNTLGKIRLGNKHGRYLYIMYIITKLLYIAAPITILYLFNILVGPGYIDYGVRAMKDMIQGNDFVENPMFPKVTYCDMSVRKLGQNLHTYTVQCVLPLNLFNEKIFLLIWWWLVILPCLSLIGLLLCMLRAARSQAFIMKNLQLMDAVNPHNSADRARAKQFTDEFLSLDGVFCLRLINLNTTDLIVGEIVSKLYKRWREVNAEREREINCSDECRDSML